MYFIFCFFFVLNFCDDGCYVDIIVDIPQKHLYALTQYNDEIQECMVYTLESLAIIFPDLMKDIVIARHKNLKNSRADKNRYKSRYHRLLYRWKDLIELFDHTDLMANILTYDYQETMKTITERKKKYIKEKYYNSLYDIINYDDPTHILLPLVRIAEWMIKLVLFVSLFLCFLVFFFSFLFFLVVLVVFIVSASCLFCWFFGFFDCCGVVIIMLVLIFLIFDFNCQYSLIIMK